MDPELAVPPENLLKSGEAVIPRQFLHCAPGNVFHVTPLSMETYMSPQLIVLAASLVKSGVEVIPYQLLLPALEMALQITPLFEDM
jgi:hypothetical protein